MPFELPVTTLKMLDEIWHQGGYVFLAVKNRKTGKWSDHCFEYPEQPYKYWARRPDSFPLHDDPTWQAFWKRHNPAKVDVYFCPLRFCKQRRLEGNALPIPFLWSDLDEGGQKILGQYLEPSYMWETSPGKYQGVWPLRGGDDLDIKQLAELNKRMTYTVHGDPSGWDLTQVLRLPGTRNHKYPNAPEVGFVKYAAGCPAKFDVSKLKKLLVKTEEIETKTSIEIDFSSTPVSKLLKKARKLVSRWTYTRLTQTSIPDKGKRSEVLWRMENELFQAGMELEEIASLIQQSVWNKYAGRPDELERLRRDLERVLNKPREEKPVEEEEPRLLRVTTYREVMQSLRTTPGWLVDKVWTRRSYGIVAGEPKSFKSTLVMELCVSVASGAPFLNEFQVVDPGPVLMIQNENADWIMRDRFEKITHARGLSGSVRQTRQGVLDVKWPKDLPITFMNQQGISLDDAEDKRIIEEACRQLKPRLVVFDPLYLMLQGDINSAQDIQPVLQWLLTLNQQFDTGIILIHHKRKQNKQNKGARQGAQMLGSTTLHGWVESAWYVDAKQPEEEDFELEGEATPQVEVQITREFRGAGVNRPLNVGIRMGPMGTADYECEVELANAGVKSALRVISQELEDSTGIEQGKLLAILADGGFKMEDLREAMNIMRKKGMVKISDGIVHWAGEASRDDQERAGARRRGDDKPIQVDFRDKMSSEHDGPEEDYDDEPENVSSYSR